MSIRLKIKLFVAVLFIAAISNAVFTFQLEAYGEVKLKWVNHTHEVINKTERLFGGMKDAETGQRGFLLTKNAIYLAPYYNGVINAKNNFKELKELTSDNPVQQKRLKSIEYSMVQKFKELSETIELTQKSNSGMIKALSIVKENKGKGFMDDIRNTLIEFSNTERVLLEQRKGDFRENRAHLTTLIAIEIIFFVFLALMTISFLNKSLFAPLELLLSSTLKMESGQKVEITDVVSNDEMGYLLSRFFKMQEKVHKRTEVLDYKAHHDELTGLKNRTNMFEEIANSIEKLDALSRKCAVFFIDLNKFKQLNDTLGHDVGDEVLKETANRLKSTVRSDDVVFRNGGDEFLVLIKNIQSVSEVQRVVSNILDAFKPPVVIKTNTINIMLSIGIAISPDDSTNSGQIVKFSDIAMYEAKRHNDCDYKFFDRGMLKRTSDL